MQEYLMFQAHKSERGLPGANGRDGADSTGSWP